MLLSLSDRCWRSRSTAAWSTIGPAVSLCRISGAFSARRTARRPAGVADVVPLVLDREAVDGLLRVGKTHAVTPFGGAHDGFPATLGLHAGPRRQVGTRVSGRRHRAQGPPRPVRRHGRPADGLGRGRVLHDVLIEVQTDPRRVRESGYPLGESRGTPPFQALLIQRARQLPAMCCPGSRSSNDSDLAGRRVRSDRHLGRGAGCGRAAARRASVRRRRVHTAHGAAHGSSLPHAAPLGARRTRRAGPQPVPHHVRGTGAAARMGRGSVDAAVPERGRGGPPPRRRDSGRAGARLRRRPSELRAARGALRPDGRGSGGARHRRRGRGRPRAGAVCLAGGRDARGVDVRGGLSAAGRRPPRLAPGAHGVRRPGCPRDRRPGCGGVRRLRAGVPGRGSAVRRGIGCGSPRSVRRAVRRPARVPAVHVRIDGPAEGRRGHPRRHRAARPGRAGLRAHGPGRLRAHRQHLVRRRHLRDLGRARERRAPGRHPQGRRAEPAAVGGPVRGRGRHGDVHDHGVVQPVRGH